MTVSIVTMFIKTTPCKHSGRKKKASAKLKANDYKLTCIQIQFNSTNKRTKNKNK